MDTKSFTVDGYQRHLREHRIMASRCTRCDSLHLPPRPICPACHSQDMAWKQLDGDATVIGFTSVAIVSSGMAARGFGHDNPYLTAIVAFREGPNIAARIEVGETEDLESSAYVGMPVRADFLDEEERVTLVFRPQ